ncbi:excinuclease ABC subunit UvrC [bacterium 19MO03SA05]|uniref:UvrABC system protein C n=1 Tax=bacterium 19MO03SA05 TaxID=2920620 RepID=A0AAU6VB18_UNCXX|nr:MULTISPECIES: excinuclease ABC subunit UvrC [unclassified Vibrio]EKO3571089.1 excinuclease ABC subunit UvrC [Vibrio metschnikovii]EKO3922357.1 excinuclease ABC subunit UvrC [Vibrio metschnikovii]MDQ2106971.1 excinuclease ABC subunit UvrC [Vibrio sp. 2017_1457_15]MDQ2159783.1 excinuclease ABC subunit UvrC [Vibrio sp. 2017_1457_13]MDQ2188851.1 excinuclease ABC subunit UvrC [Vibrio sp. A14(2019)]
MADFDSASFLKNVTHQPGVYRMYNTEAEVIYVGKAKDLKKRLSSYFRSKVDSEKTRALVSHINKIDVTVTHTETEALILEHNYIKQYLPKYNVLLRDDKSYPYIFISAHKHPRLSAHRGAKKRKGEYFGPYPDSGAVRETLHLIQKIFPVRQCEDTVYSNRVRPCLMYQIGRCAAPCVSSLISDADYAELVNYVRLFLQGKDKQVLEVLVRKMETASQALRFEDAAKFRDQIQAIRRVQEQQFVAEDSQDDLDVLGFAQEKGLACIHILMIRQGKVLGSRSFFPKIPANTESQEVFESFLSQYYLNHTDSRVVPSRIILNQGLLKETKPLQLALRELAGHNVHFHVSPTGTRGQYLKLSNTNALSAMTSKLNHKMTIQQRVNELQRVLGIDNVTRMECFDISHTMGESTVASCVVFNQEGPLKAEYRRYNITGITGGDDYAAMAQALERRYAKQLDVDKIPDVIFIDGGKGQLNRALQIITQCWQDWPKRPQLIGIAKGISRKPGLETLITTEGDEFHLPSDAPALHLIQHIRDESHNHAITGHRAKRGKTRRTSTLEGIEGVGPKRRQALLKYMGGLQEIKRATVEEIAKVPGISHSLAEIIYQALKP